VVRRAEAGPRRHPAPARVATRTAGVAARTVGAIGGGYALAASAAAAAAAWLPLSRPEATLAGMLASFAVFAGAILWCFAARSAIRALAGLALPLALLLTAWWGR
jgi:hypothetical protein